MEVRKILLTTDLSETARAAFPAAIDLARRYDAEIVLLHVEDDHLPPLVVEYMAVGIDEMRRRQSDHARQELQQLAEKFPADLRTRVLIAPGPPHAGILQVAEEEEADLLVMATHGRGFITHALLGSTTERVIRRARCPVLVIRAEVEED